MIKTTSLMKWNAYSICIQLLIGSYQTSGFLIDGSQFQQELKKVADEALGVSDMQREYDKLSYSKTTLTGKELLKTLTNSISSKIDGLVDALKEIKDAVQDNYDQFSDSPTTVLCCQAPEGTFDYKYRSKVNHDTACSAQSSSAGSDKKFASSEIVTAMKNNYKDNPNIIWQYYAGDDGTYINYPSVRMNKCDYDPRYRPYYAAGASPNPKDVVIVLDKSGSMTSQHDGRSLLQIAQEATVTVINTLTPSDRIGVVAFDNVAHTPQSADCFSDTLAMATEANKRILSVYINSLSADDGTNYGDALNTAFDFFIKSEKSIQGEERDTVILFLTDGDNAVTDPDPLTVIRDKNKLLNNTVVIHTYGLGYSLTDAGVKLLKDMSKQVINDQSFGETKEGRSQKIEDITSLRNAMGSYYNFFARDRQTSSTFSVPYLDEFSQSGLVSSLCLPTYYGGAFKGVVCTDLKLSDLLSDVTYFETGDASYAFIIDGFGRALVHPLLPKPENVNEDPSFYDIQYFERSKDAESIIASMKSGNSGNKTINSAHTVARGTMLMEGVITNTLKNHYYWSKVPNSNYSLCVVIGDQDYRTELVTTHQPSNDVFVYHRRDIQPGQLQNCRHYARYATVERSCVMLTPSAFKEPFKYLDEKETEIKIEAYKRFVKGQSTVNPGLKDTIRNTVIATYVAEPTWKLKQEHAKYVIWRYITTTDGVVRMYPGVQLTKDYDLSQRPWYRRTLAHKDMYVLHAPYKDAWGSGYLISLTRTLFEGKKNGVHSKSDKVIAVMGTDFPIRYFYQLVLTTYSICNTPGYSCMVIDDSGFLVIHPDFVEQIGDPNLDNLYNIVHKEGDIAVDLISKGVLSKTHCSDFQTGKRQYTYRIALSTLNKNGIETDDYELRPVPESNIFIVIKKKQEQRYASCCADGNISPDKNKCHSNGANCGCLCYGELDYFACENRYDIGDSSPTCNSRAPVLQSVSEQEKDKILNLDTCFKLDCETRLSESSCYSIGGCNWCSYTADEEKLDPKFCALKEKCPFGKCDRDEDCQAQIMGLPTTPAPPEDKPTAPPIIGIVVGVVVGVLLIILIIAIVFVRRRRKKKEDPYLHPVSTITGKHDIDTPPASPLEPYMASPEQHNIAQFNRYDEMPTFGSDNSYIDIRKSQ